MILDNIKELCKKKKITISTLEKEAGIGNGAVARWDKSSPNLDSLQKVAKYFKVSVNYLLRG